MAKYIIASNVKKICQENNRRLGADFLNALDCFVEQKIREACKIHNGGKITLDKDVAAYVGLNNKRK